MSFRNLDGSGDWTFGLGRNNYVHQNQEIGLNAQTRVLSFLGDCFFAINEGIDYFNLMDYNKREQLENKIKSVIMETPGVEEIRELDLVLDSNRQLTLNYNVITQFSTPVQNSIPLLNV